MCRETQGARAAARAPWECGVDRRGGGGGPEMARPTAGRARRGTPGGHAGRDHRVPHGAPGRAWAARRVVGGWGSRGTVSHYIWSSQGVTVSKHRQTPRSPSEREGGERSAFLAACVRQCAVTLGAAGALLVASPPPVALAGLLPAPAFQNLAAPAARPSNTQGALSKEEQNSVNVFERSKPGVVFITNLQSARDRITFNVTEVPAGSGTGFAWDARHIVTNYHVIKGASDLRVTLSDQRSYPASVAGFDEDRDVAVLKLDLGSAEAAQLRPLEVGSSEGLRVGQKVFAIGNPFGLDHTMTAGIISGVGREIMSPTGRPIRGAVQTDAAINPGNSGGPLLDRQGRLIGINTSILDPTGRGANAGVGFAIPVGTVEGIVNQIINFGQITRPVLGLVLAPDPLLSQLTQGRQAGVLVLDAASGSPADGKVVPTRRDQFGRIVLGDVILGVDGQPVKNSADLFRVLDTRKAGDTVRLRLLRGGDTEVEESVKLGSRVTKFDQATDG